MMKLIHYLKESIYKWANVCKTGPNLNNLEFVSAWLGHRRQIQEHEIFDIWTRQDVDSIEIVVKIEMSFHQMHFYQEEEVEKNDKGKNVFIHWTNVLTKFKSAMKGILLKTNSVNF